MKTTGLAAWVILMVLAMPQYAPPKRSSPLQREQVIGAWFGLTDSDVYLYRIELHADGTGLLASEFLEHEPRCHRVAR